MKRTVAMLLLVLTGCARVYRPVALATPRPSAAGALGGSLTPQPWGDNSRYEGRAVGAHLQVLLLRVENRGSETVDLLGVEPSEDGAVWTPEEALDQVRQVGALYLLYPVAPGLLASHYSASSATSLDAIPAAAFRALALVGLMVGAGNLVVAEHSNLRLGAFFKAEAWRPGPLPPGGTRQGLVFLRRRGPGPHRVDVVVRAAGGERRLRLSTAGSAL